MGFAAAPRSVAHLTPCATRAVTTADLADNTDPARLAVLDDATRQRLEARYARARQLLAPLEGTTGER